MPTTFRQVIGNVIAIAGVLAAFRIRNRTLALYTGVGAFMLAIRIGDLSDEARPS